MFFVPKAVMELRMSCCRNMQSSLTSIECNDMSMLTSTA